MTRVRYAVCLLLVLTACSLPGGPGAELATTGPPSTTTTLQPTTTTVPPTTTTTAVTSTAPPTTVATPTTAAAAPSPVRACRSLQTLVAEAEAVTAIRRTELAGLADPEAAPPTPEADLLQRLTVAYETLASATAGRVAAALREERIAPLQLSLRSLASTGGRLDPEATDDPHYLVRTLPAARLVTLPLLPERAQRLVRYCRRPTLAADTTLLTAGTVEDPSPSMMAQTVLSTVHHALGGFVRPEVLDGLPDQCRGLANSLEQGYADEFGPPRIYAQVSGEVLASAGMLCEIGPPEDDESAPVAHVRLLADPAWYHRNFASARASRAVEGAVVRSSGSPLWSDQLGRGNSWLVSALLDPRTGAVVAVSVPSALGNEGRDAAMVEVLESVSSG